MTSDCKARCFVKKADNGWVQGSTNRAGGMGTLAAAIHIVLRTLAAAIHILLCTRSLFSHLRTHLLLLRAAIHILLQRPARNPNSELL